MHARGWLRRCAPDGLALPVTDMGDHKFEATLCVSAQAAKSAGSHKCLLALDRLFACGRFAPPTCHVCSSLEKG